ncbi:anti-sigma factor domain-containing protein [Pseudooctadecabacter sp.]|uniref:anti-sigma factor n=1 Tax=Pseudooctadecabacter sp. TaxID=1966338 RepID=UPI0025F7D4D1|nr:anti-sigma factor [Pseudooctadecabacter sp.]
MTDDSLTPDEFGDDVLAAEYALGVLTGQTHADAAARARTDPAFAVEVNAWQDRLAALTEAVAPVAPPRGLFKRIRREAFGEARGGFLRQLGIIPAIMGATAAAVVLYATVQLGVFTQPGEPTPTLVAQMVAEDNTLVVAAAYTDDGSLFVERRVGASAPGRVLELWLISGEDAPVSLGVLAQDQVLDQITVPEGLRDRLTGGVLAISDEPQGGSPTGAPTGAVLAVGEIMTL